MSAPTVPVNALPFSLAPSALYATPLIYQTPYVQQFSLDVQRSIGSTMMVDVGYFGDHGTHLQPELQLAAGQEDQAVQRLDACRHQLHLPARVDQRRVGFELGPAEHLQP